MHLFCHSYNCIFIQEFPFFTIISWIKNNYMYLLFSFSLIFSLNLKKQAKHLQGILYLCFFVCFVLVLFFVLWTFCFIFFIPPWAESRKGYIKFPSMRWIDSHNFWNILDLLDRFPKLCSAGPRTVLQHPHTCSPQPWR